MKNTKTIGILTCWIGVVALLAPPPPAAAQNIQKEIEVSSGELLEIDLENGGSISISGWDRNAVSIDAEPTGRYKDRAAQSIDIRRTDEGVSISSDMDHSDSGKHWGKHSSGFKLTIRVPFVFDLEIDSMGGGIHIDSVEGTIEGETMGGELDLSNLKGELDLSTMGGEIKLIDSEVDGEVETMGGKVLLENVIGDVKGSSMGGNVIYKNVTRPDGSGTGDKLIISTMGGDVEAGEAWNGARLETMGGNIRLQAAAESVYAETMGGNIELGSVDGWVEATTMGGDIEVTIVGDPQAGDHHVTLESMGGEIHLTVPRNFSADIEIELAYTKGRKEKYEIKSDLQLQQTESASWSYDHGSPRKVIKANANVAGGKNKVKIKTINGNVILKEG